LWLTLFKWVVVVECTAADVCSIGFKIILRVRVAVSTQLLIMFLQMFDPSDRLQVSCGRVLKPIWDVHSKATARRQMSMLGHADFYRNHRFYQSFKDVRNFWSVLFKIT
jgi:hypothetical protein